MTQLLSASIYCVYPDCETTNHLIYLKAEKAKKAEKNVGSINRKTTTLGLTG